MATMADLPYDLVYYIILLLVQSPGGAADFARILSVCRKFLLFAQDERMLKLVNFDIKMELRNFKRYQHINSQLVKCSEAGNVAAQFFLGKVILVSSSQLLLGQWVKERDFHPCDLATTSELSCILATNVPPQRHKAGSFMAYFSPKQESTSELSQTRLVHYQLVKLFLLNGSPYDLSEMSVFLKSYINFFTGVTEEGSPLLRCIKSLLFHADTVKLYEKQLMEANQCFAGWQGFEGLLKEISNCIDAMKSNLAESRAQALRFFDLYWDTVTRQARIVNI